MGEWPLSFVADAFYSFSFNKFAAIMIGENPKDKLAKEDFYLSEEGYIIFTEAYHLKRGYCCQSGCKHCPYGFNKTKLKDKKA